MERYISLRNSFHNVTARAWGEPKQPAYRGDWKQPHSFSHGQSFWPWVFNFTESTDIRRLAYTLPQMWAPHGCTFWLGVWSGWLACIARLRIVPLKHFLMQEDNWVLRRETSSYRLIRGLFGNTLIKLFLCKYFYFIRYQPSCRNNTLILYFSA